LLYDEALIFTLCGLYRLQGRELNPRIVWLLSKALMHDFKSSSFVRENTGNNPDEHSSSMVHDTDMDSNPLKLFAIPFKKEEDNPRAQHESYISALGKLRDQVAFSISMHTPHVSTHTLKWISYKYFIVGFIKFVMLV